MVSLVIRARDAIGLFGLPLLPIDFYISPTGTGTAASGGTQADPWPITMISNATAQARYAGHTVGLLDGVYDLHTAMNSQAQYFALLNIASGSSGSPSVITAVNPRQAILNAKSGSIYGGLFGANDGNVMIGQDTGVTTGHVTLRGLKITGVKTCPVRFGTLDYSGGAAYAPGITVEDCEIYDCSALTGLETQGNLGAVSFSNCTGLIFRNNYIHDVVGYVANEANHLQGYIQWNCRNSTIEDNTIVRSGIGIYAKVDGSYGGTIRRNYVDTSNNTDWAAGLLDWAGNAPTSVVGGSILSITNNVIVSMECLALHRGGTAQRMMSETLEVYNNTLIHAGGSNGPGSYLMASANSPGSKVYNNLCSNRNAAGSVKALTIMESEYGAMSLCVGPQAIIDYNAYAGTQNKWTTFANGASTYPSNFYTGLPAWRTANAGATGGEQHSQLITDPSWVNTGAYAQRYRLNGGSTAVNAGKVGGIVSGGATDLGAYGNGNTRVGCDFATE